MRVLAPRTTPPSKPIERDHTPRDGSFRLYRDCLRWDFGFTCPFCLLHESDLVEHGAHGTGLTTVEHRVPQSEAPRMRNKYQNCYYACVYCNRARSNRPITDSTKRSLLDPCTHAWAEHFYLEGDELVPSDGDGDAAYTREAYDLNAPRKVTTRRFRRIAQLDRLRLMREQRPALEFLNGLIRKPDLAEQREELVKLAREIRRRFRIAAVESQRYRVIPTDAPTDCRCNDRSDYRIPASIFEQSVEVQVP